MEELIRSLMAPLFIVGFSIRAGIRLWVSGALPGLLASREAKTPHADAWRQVFAPSPMPMLAPTPLPNASAYVRKVQMGSAVPGVGAQFSIEFRV